jgi:flagellin
MGLFINTNLSSLNAQRRLTSTSNMLGRSFERLSSGLRINGAKDDAAGLAITNRITAQVRGLNQAVRNSNDGISLAQTAEGALNETTNILQRMRELSVQSANDTNNTADRQSLQAEIAQLKDELDRIATTTNFNGNKLLDGSFLAREIQVGANVGETLSVSVASASTKDLARQARYPSSRTNANFVSSGQLTGFMVNGTTVRDTVNADDTTSTVLNSSSAIAKAAAINDSSITTGVRAIVGETTITGNAPISTVALDEDTFITINDQKISGFDVESNDATNTLVDAINTHTTGTGVVASLTEGGALNLTAADGRNISLRVSESSLATALGIDTANVATFTGSASVNLSLSDQVADQQDFTFAGLSAGNAASYSNAGVSTAIDINGTSINVVDGDFEQDIVDKINASGAQAGGQAISATLSAGGDIVLSASGTTSTIDVSITAGSINAFSGISGAVSSSTASLSSNFETTSAASTLTIDGNQFTIGAGLTAAGVEATLNSQFGAGSVLSASVTGNTLTITTTSTDNTTFAVSSSLADISSGSAAVTRDNFIATGVLTLQSNSLFELGDGTGVNDASAQQIGFVNDGVYGINSEHSVATVDITSREGAVKALDTIDLAIENVSAQRATLGALQNRLDSTINNLSTTSENLSASRSRIMDADFAAETAMLSRNQIIQQASVSILAQANQQPQLALSLLG